MQLVMATALVVGCAVSSVTLWYYSRRYVGELSLLRDGAKTGSRSSATAGSAPPPRLCFSVLDFWGRREVRISHACTRHACKRCLCKVFCYWSTWTGLHRWSCASACDMQSLEVWVADAWDMHAALLCVQDNIVDTERLVPPLQGCSPEELRAMAAQPLLPVDVEGDRQYILSLRYGRLVDKRALLAVLQGRADEAVSGGVGGGLCGRPEGYTG